jgi:hypothetical protein
VPYTPADWCFVHILDEAGNVISQQDRLPLAGYRPTSSWQPAELIVDRFAYSDRLLFTTY